VAVDGGGSRGFCLKEMGFSFHDGGRERRAGPGRVWRRNRAQIAGLAADSRERGRERERATADDRTVHQKLWTSTLTSYRVVEIATCTTGIWLFAECHILCRVPRKNPSVKENTRRRSSLPSVLFLTLGKELFAECFFANTRQRQFKNHILK
jgi:hypothetical protein